MGDDKLSYNCRMELTKEDKRTSTEIGTAFIPSKTVMYDKLPFPKIPVLRMDKRYKPGTIYSPLDDLKTTYREAYHVPTAEDNLNVLPSKLLKQHQEYSKMGILAKPMKFGLSEYKEEFPIKEIPLPLPKSSSLNEKTTCPMITTGRDERDPLPLTQNYNKYLDIYLSTSRLAHRAFTLHEQRTVAMKDIVTSQETMDIPKGRGFGCRFQVFAGQDLDSRDTNMTDRIFYATPPKPRYMPKKMPKVPNFGSESETKASYGKPEGFAVAKLFSKFAEHPQSITAPTAKQALSPPGMYTTESYAINNHTSPQAVV